MSTSIKDTNLETLLQLYRNACIDSAFCKQKDDYIEGRKQAFRLSLELIGVSVLELQDIENKAEAKYR